MMRLTQLLGAILAVALLVAPAWAMQDMDHGSHAAESAAETDHASHGDHADHEDHASHSMGDADAVNHDDHDHAAMMEQAGATVGIEEKLGDIVADVDFLDADGNRVNLRELTRDIPTVILPIYYRCPDVCNMIQGSFATILPDVKLEPGKEIQIVSISFDPREGVDQAERARRTYQAAMGEGFPAEHWKFLVGDQQAINGWLDSIGYTVKREGALYAHPVGVVVTSPGGKVVRYLYGSSFLPFDITMAGAEAATGKTGLSLKRVLSMCYNYDPQGRRYVFSILRVSGFGIGAFVLLFVAYLVFGGKKRKRDEA